MSNVGSNEPPEFDFWEFVSCVRCHLPFAPDSGAQPSVPFWITECGHVVCNNHLNPDQSCPQCGTRDIQVAALQRELEAPMSEWFRSVPERMDSLAYTARFQIETLANLVRYYKHKCTKQRALLGRQEQELNSLRKRVQDLQTEPEQVRHRDARYGQFEPSDVRNSNGKRQMSNAHRHQNGVRSNSSPRSVMTPIGPDRLTLPPKHSASHARQQFNSDDSVYHHSQPRQMEMQSLATNDRPGSSRFARQFAYVPPSTQQADHFSDPVRQSNAPSFQRTSANDVRVNMVPPPSARKMPPPPIPSVQPQRSQHVSQHPSVQSVRQTPARLNQSFSNAPQARPTNYFQPPLIPAQNRNNTIQQSGQLVIPSSNRFSMPSNTAQFGSRTGSMVSTKNVSGGQRVPFVPNS